MKSVSINNLGLKNDILVVRKYRLLSNYYYLFVSNNICDDCDDWIRLTLDSEVEGGTCSCVSRSRL